MKRLLVWLRLVPCPDHNFVPMKGGAFSRDGRMHQIGKCTLCRERREFSVDGSAIEQIQKFWKQKEKEQNDSDRAGTH